MEYPKVCLRRGEESGVLKGQRLIYDNELDWADDICADGCVVDVLDSRQHFVARGWTGRSSLSPARCRASAAASALPTSAVRPCLPSFFPF